MTGIQTNPSKDESDLICMQCENMIGEGNYLKCSVTGKAFHSTCLPEGMTRIPIREESWKCNEARRCVNCLGKCDLNKDQAPLYNPRGNHSLVCFDCNVCIHYNCLDPKQKLSLPKITQEKTVQYWCENCQICWNCNAREAGKNKNSKWSRDFKLCAECNKKKSGKKFCPVCEVFWNEKDTTMVLCDDSC